MNAINCNINNRIKKIDKPYSHQSAFTLIELIITLAIIAILANISFPSFNNLIDRTKISAEVNALSGLLRSTRNTAINHSEKVTICPSGNGLICTKEWSQGYMAFIDFNGDRQFNQNDQLLQQHKIENKKISLRWRAFGIRNSLQWHQTGITNHQNGSFEYCYADEPKLARGLFITKAGRVRLSKDTNGDDIHENARGDNIGC